MNTKAKKQTNKRSGVTQTLRDGKEIYFQSAQGAFSLRGNFIIVIIISEETKPSDAANSNNSPPSHH